MTYCDALGGEAEWSNRTEERTMQPYRRLAVLVIGLVSLSATAALAASGKLKATPIVFDPDNSGIVVAEWRTGVGEPDAGTSDHGLVLEKNGPTSTNAAAVVDVEGVEGQSLSALGFDIANGSWCGAGSPRVNVRSSDGVLHFYACFYGTKTDLGNGWTHVEFGPATPFAGDGFGKTIERIQIVVDEGNDVSGLGTPGKSVVDDIDVNGVVVGKPGSTG
jgi:hypothetical protein